MGGGKRKEQGRNNTESGEIWKLRDLVQRPTDADIQSTVLWQIIFIPYSKSKEDNT